MFLRFSTLFSTDGDAVPAGPPSVIAPDRWFTMAEGSDVSVVVTQLPLDGGSTITDIEESVNGGAWASLGATAPGIYASAAGPSDTIRLRAVNVEGVASPSASKSVAAGLIFTAAVTSTDTLNEFGEIERLVTSPAHLAAFDAGEGVPGLYRFNPTTIAAPRILYPGAVAMSPLTSGGTISLTQAPWAVGRGATTLGYRVLLGGTAVATALPYVTTQDPGARLSVVGDAVATDGTTSIEIGLFTIAEASAGPVLSAFSIDYENNKWRIESDIAATVTWRRYPPGHVFTNKGAEVLAGTGAIDGGSFAMGAGAETRNITYTGGLSGDQELWVVARVGSGPLSDVVGGAIRITPAGSTLTPPNFRGSSIGGDGTGVGVPSAAVPLPADVEMAAGDLLTLPIGIDCAADLIAGLTVTGPNGEVAVRRQELTDNGVAGDDGQSIGLWYYRNLVARTGGNTTIAIAPGGAKSQEQIICTPIARFSAKASGDPFAQVVKTSSAVATLTAQTAALTAVSAGSRIEACIISEFELPPGSVPEGWFLRQVGRIGPQSIQTISRNAPTTAGEVIPAISLPLPVARRWVALTWELLPLGA